MNDSTQEIAQAIVEAMDREYYKEWDRPHKHITGIFNIYNMEPREEQELYYWLHVEMKKREFAQRLTVPRAIHGVEKLSDISNDLDAWVDRLAKVPYDIPQTAAMQQVIDELDTAVARLMECVEEMECWKF